MTLSNHTVPITLFAGEWICKAKWFAPIGNSTEWYFDEGISTYVRMSTVLIPDMSVNPESPNNVLPKHLKKIVSSFDNATILNAIKIDESFFDFIQEEIKIRDTVDQILKTVDEEDELMYVNASYCSDTDDLDIFEDYVEKEL